MVKKAIVLFALLSLFHVSAYSHIPDGIFVSMSLSKSSVNSDDPILLTIAYENVTEQPIRMLMRGTALEGGIFDDFLDVKLDGRRIHYSGWHAKRLPPTDTEYVTLLPKDKRVVSVDVASGYAMVEKGIYEVQYKLDPHTRNLESNFSTNSRGLSVSPPKVSIKLVEDRPVYLLKRVSRNINNSCSATEFLVADTALSVAEEISISASSDLSNAPLEKRPTATRYLEWFGVYEPARYGQVSTGMTAIALAAANQVVGFDCDCAAVFGNQSSNIFAAVNPNDPYNILLCDVFWRVRLRGTDSQSGTLVHELSHFNVVAGTDDFSNALDQNGSRLLADTSPASAIKNANAYEYFAENTPFLPMPSDSGDDDNGDDDPNSDDSGDKFRIISGLIAAILAILFE